MYWKMNYPWKNCVKSLVASPCTVGSIQSSTWVIIGSEISVSSTNSCLGELSLELWELTDVGGGEGDCTRGADGGCIRASVFDVAGGLCSIGVGPTASCVCEES